jgi:hypothetical protein
MVKHQHAARVRRAGLQFRVEPVAAPKSSSAGASSVDALSRECICSVCAAVLQYSSHESVP